MKEKKYDLYFENSVKVKSLNDDYFKCYQEIEKALFKKQKNTLKTNVLLAEIIEQMISSQEKGKTVQQLVGQNTQSFVDQINKKLNYKEKINQLKQRDFNKRYQVSTQPFIVEIISIIISLLIAILFYNSPFDITFVILVIAFFTSKKMYSKSLNN